jgi:hypothetical protein
VKTGIQIFFNGSPLPWGQCLDPGACPGHDPAFAGVTLQEIFYETILIGQKDGEIIPFFANLQGRAVARPASVINREKEKLAWDTLSIIVFSAIHG